MLAIGSVEPTIATAIPQAQRLSPGPTFEVASIRQNRSGSGNFSLHSDPGGRLTVINETVAQLVDYAYTLGDFQRQLVGGSSRITGGPAWITSERYDVIASAGREVTLEERKAMMRALLLERFKLVAHHERKDHPTYAVMLVRADGKLGPQMRRTEVDCRAIAAANAKYVGGQGPLPAKAANGAPPCGASPAIGELKSGGLTMDDLAARISGAAGRPVVNKTGLDGNYEFSLMYSAPGAGANGTADDRPSIFTALREQLGLKLEPQLNPLEFLVIDRIERPTPN